MCNKKYAQLTDLETHGEDKLYVTICHRHTGVNFFVDAAQVNQMWLLGKRRKENKSCPPHA